MNMKDEWKDEYAPSTAAGLYPAKRKVPFLFHHVHPYVPGRAHCRPTVHLRMDEVITTPPPIESYCPRCRNTFLNGGFK